MKNSRHFFAENKNFRYVKWLFAILCIIGIISFIRLIRANAVTNEEDTVHIQSSDIDNGTLIIGTHLIYLDSMTEEIYEIAKDSQAQSNQYLMYYKSELADGAWYEISSAQNITDISSSEKIVAASVVEALNVRYHTKQDKITYDLLTSQPINAFDINKPYDNAKNQDLESIQNQLENIKGRSDKSASDTYYEKLLDNFMKLDLTDENTKKIDSDMDALWQKSLSLVRNEDELADIVSGIMGVLDAERKSDVCEKLSEAILPQLLEQANDTGSKDISVNTEVTSAIADAISKVADSQAQNQSKGLASGNLISSQIENELITQAVEAAKSQEGSDGNNNSVDGNGGNSSGNDDDSNNSVDGNSGNNSENGNGNNGMESKLKAALKNVEAFHNITNGITADDKTELALLQEKLISSADEKIKELFSAGVSEKYQTQAANGASKLELQNILEEQQRTIGQFLNELDYYIKAAAGRMSEQNAKEFLEARINAADSFTDAAKEDALKPYLQELISQLKTSLEDKLNAYHVGGDNELDSLAKEKQRLQLEKLKALDTNQLKEAKKYDQLLEEIQTKINETEAKLNAVISSDTATDAQKAEALKQLGTPAVVSQIQEQKENALQNISDKEYAYIGDSIDSISVFTTIAPQSVQAALQEIYQKLVTEQVLKEDLSQSDKELLKAAAAQIDKIAEEQADTFLGSEMDTASVYNLVKEVLGKDFQELADKEQAEILEAVCEYAAYLNSPVLENTAVSMASGMYSNDNPFVYLKLKNETGKFLNLEALAQSLHFRYVYSDSNKEGVLRNGTNYYYFCAFSTVVKKQNEASEMLSDSVKMQSGLYIPEDYASNTFSCKCTYIDGCDFGLLYTEDMNEGINRFYAALLR